VIQTVFNLHLQVKHQLLLVDTWPLTT